MTEALGNQIKASRARLILSLIFILVIGIISNYIYVLAVYVGPLSEFHGWSPNSIVLAYSVAMFIMIPAFMVGQVISNKFGTKRVMVASSVIYGLAILLSGMVKNVTLFVVCQGIMGSIGMYGILICTIQIVNVLYPTRKGLVMGLLYGSQAAGAGLLAPVATLFIENFNVSMALILQGVIFTIILFVCSIFITDPTNGEAVEVEEETVDLNRPSMTWKKMLTHPGFYLMSFGIIAIQMIGNVLITDAAYLAETVYQATPAQSAFAISVFSMAAGLGGVVVGYVSDKIGPFMTTAILGILDGILLAILAIAGADNYTMFVVILVIQGFTYNGITTLNPVMATEAFGGKDLGICIGFTGISSMAVSFIGPQLGLSVPFVPMIMICAVLSVIGGFLFIACKKTYNTYYKGIGSNVVLK